MRSAALPLMLLFSACAQQPWINPYIDDPVLLSRQYAIDSGHCESVASGSVPQPPVRIYESSRATPYFVTGQSRTNYSSGGSSTTTYSGTVTPYPQVDYAASFARGMELGNAIAAANSRKRVLDGCMMQLGWTLDASEAAYLRSKFEAPQKADQPEPVTGSYVDPVQEVINTIPELRRWQESNDVKWQAAVTVDTRMRESGLYDHLSLRDRFLLVVDEVESAASQSVR
jgi:hypothetical protein